MTAKFVWGSPESLHGGIQRMKRRKLLLLTVALLLVLSFTLAPVMAKAAPKNGWYKEGGNWYYYDWGYKLYGWWLIGDYWYHFNTYTGAMDTGWQYIDGHWYYFNGSGIQLLNWQYINGHWYYFDTRPGYGGLMARGIWRVDGKEYYFDTDTGAMQTGWQAFGENWYYYNTSGELATGWKIIGNRVYYLIPEQGGQMAIGTYQIDGWDYHFNEQNGCLDEYGDFYLNGKSYFITQDGTLLNGWYMQDYTDPETGITEYGRAYYAPTLVTGWRQVDGKWYYFDSALGGMMIVGWKTISGKTYYFSETEPLPGAMAANWFRIGQDWYYADSSGAQKTGWQKLSNVWYYLDSNEGGKMATGWKTISGVNYYFKSSGAMATGWVQVDGGWYYMDSSGTQKTGWQKIGSTWYYLDPANGGRMASGVTMNINGTNYTFNASGAWAA